MSAHRLTKLFRQFIFVASIFTWIVFISLSLALSGCSNSGGSGLDFTPPKNKTTAVEPTFASLNENVFVPKCVSCHTPPSAENDVDLTSYEAIMSLDGLVVPREPEQSPLYLVVVHNQMPKGAAPLSNEEKDALAKWIADGALSTQITATPTPEPTATPTPQPTPVPTATPSPSAVRFSQIFEGALKNKCVSCHSGILPKGLVNLTTYAKVIGKKGLVVAGQPDKSKLWTEVSKGNMPPKGEPTLTASEKNLIFKWISDGALE